jgi:hypothetical protein
LSCLHYFFLFSHGTFCFLSRSHTYHSSLPLHAFPLSVYSVCTLTHLPSHALTRTYLYIDTDTILVGGLDWIGFWIELADGWLDWRWRRASCCVRLNDRTNGMKTVFLMYFRLV